MIGQNNRSGTQGTPAGQNQNTADRTNRSLEKVLEQIEEALHGLRFGQVTITVQDGVVVQIDRLERTRLQKGEGRMSKDECLMSSTVVGTSWSPSPLVPWPLH